MGKPRGNNPAVNSIVPDQPDMPDTLRRSGDQVGRPDSLPELADDTERGGDSPSTDGDNPQHPLHDEDQEDLEPEDYEDMVDEIERSGPQPLMPERDGER
jgi:hypothetical protein